MKLRVIERFDVVLNSFSFFSPYPIKNKHSGVSVSIVFSLQLSHIKNIRSSGLCFVIDFHVPFDGYFRIPFSIFMHLLPDIIEVFS